MKNKARICTLLLFLFLLRLSAVAQNSNVVLLGNVPFPGQTLASVCGYAAGGKEYALCCASKGLTIVDVSNPSNPIQILQIPGVQSTWREVAVYRNFAYVVTEGSGGALQIVDLTNLPAANLSVHSYTGDGAISGQLSTAHTLQVDTTRKTLYLYGSNLANGGTLALDIAPDPYNPVYVGSLSTYYIHGGFADNDTMYAANIYQGFFSVIDFRNKSAPILLQTQPSPSSFTHSTWLSDNRKILFVTDEATGAPLSSFDISDLQNIREMDEFRSNPGSGSIPHNIHIRNGWAVTSWYRDGLVIVDAHRPQNLVEVGNYDTYPSGSGSGMDGAWEAYPYLPSANILVSNVNEGLFILAPQYLRACYLEGNVVDSLCNTPIHNAIISIDSTQVYKNSDLDGTYHTGYFLPGSYNVRFSKPGYTTKIIQHVLLAAGNISNLQIQLVPVGIGTFSSVIRDQITLKPLAGACVQLQGAQNYLFYTDSAGKLDACNVESGSYTISITKWGYRSKCLSNQSLNALSTNLTLELVSGYYDDCSGPTGWKVQGSSSTSWLYRSPLATYDSITQASPSDGLTEACIKKAYVTNRAGGDAWLNDVDNGYTTLTTPAFDLTHYTNPLLIYDSWFYNGGFKNGPPNDSLCVFLDNGKTTILLETNTSATGSNGSWNRKYIQLTGQIQKTPNMHLSLRISDYPPDNIVEGGLRYFEIKDSLMLSVKPVLLDNHFTAYPNPFSKDLFVSYNIEGMGENLVFEIFDLEGKLVCRQPANEPGGLLKINVDLDSGMYFLRLRTKTWISRPVKVIKN
jgi:choice-of-anchor B domain-containing protein